jgi:hypothetical protein
MYYRTRILSQIFPAQYNSRCEIWFVTLFYFCRLCNVTSIWPECHYQIVLNGCTNIFYLNRISIIPHFFFFFFLLITNDIVITILLRFYFVNYSIMVFYVRLVRYASKRTLKHIFHDLGKLFHIITSVI